MEWFGGTETVEIDSVLMGSGIFPAKEAVVAWFISEEIFSGRDWQDNTKDRKQQQSSFMRIGFQLT
jgi:hypothetical protein